MNGTEYLRALDGAEDRFVEEALAPEKKKAAGERSRRVWIGWAAAAVLVLGGTAAVLPRLAAGRTPGETERSWPLVEIRDVFTSQATGSLAETALIPKWEEMADSERFNGLIWRGNEYSTRVTVVPADRTGELLGTVKAQGYDIYTDAVHEAEVRLYALTGVTEAAAVAVQFPDSEDRWVYISRGYRPATLGELTAGLSLADEASFGEANYDPQRTDRISYVRLEDFDDAPVHRLLADNADAVILDPDTDPMRMLAEDRKLGVSLNVPLVGTEDRVLAVTESGYLYTNALEAAYVFFIGEERAQAFLDWVLDNVPGEEIVYAWLDPDAAEDGTAVVSPGWAPGDPPPAAPAGTAVPGEPLDTVVMTTASD